MRLTLRGRTLTADQKAAIVKDYLDGMEVEKICAKHGVSKGYPCTLARYAGHPKRRPNNALAAETRAAIVRDYLEGVSAKEIVRRHGVSESYATQIAERMGYPKRISPREAWGWQRAREVGPVIA